MSISVNNIMDMPTRLTRHEKVQLSFIFLIILANYHFLNLGSWWRIAGVFNVQDAANVLIWLGLLWQLMTNGIPKGIWNPISYLIIFYLLLVLVQVPLATLYYDQPLFTGLLGVRHQFFYGSFLLFWVILDSVKKIRVILNGLIIIALLALALGLVNYLGFHILSHRQLEVVRIRSGIERVFLPGMAIISMATIWVSARSMENTKSSILMSILTFVFLIAHFFRQTRMILIGVIIIIGAQFVLKKKFILLFIALIIGILGVTISEYYLPENIILSLYKKSETELVGSSGSWGGRVKQLEVDYQEFMDHPYFGSGTSALYTSHNSILSEKEWLLGYKDDLGYTHWIKFYGFVGIIWLVCFFSVLYSRARYSIRRHKSKNNDIANFCMAYIGFVLVTLITFNHLMLPRFIVPLCLVAAIIMRMSEISPEHNKSYNCIFFNK